MRLQNSFLILMIVQAFFLTSHCQINTDDVIPPAVTEPEMKDEVIVNQLKQLSFKNSGTVHNNMIFEYRSRPCYYMEDREEWTMAYIDNYYNYLYQIQDGEAFTPPVGMRSAVPMGGLGAGTVELRADGILYDWNIFNNSPAAGDKIQLGEALFFLRVKEKDNDPRTWALSTHPPKYLPAIEEIRYSGAYPVSRLHYTDPDLLLDVSLFSMSEFHIHKAVESAIPAVVFNFILENPTEEELEISLMFNLPNHIDGKYHIDNSLKLIKEGQSSVSGEMMVTMTGKDLKLSGIQSNSMMKFHRHFAAFGEFTGKSIGNYSTEGTGKHGTLAGKTALKPGQTKLITVVLAWYFPYRKHAGEVLGNHYVNLFDNVNQVTERIISNFPEIIEDIEKWHQLCFNNSLPQWLQEAMVNSVATMAKTGMWFKDGRWRQWESFSCPAVDPVHIHFYRSLPYAWFYPELRRSELRGYAAAQLKNGYIQENLGNEHTPIDKPSGRMMGDGCTAFILEIYQDYLWSGDKDFLNELWPNVIEAIEWQINRAQKYGLPHHLNNTYDWWAFEDKDIVSYNAFLHLAALKAAEKMAEVKEDQEFAATCEKNFHMSREVLIDKMWNDHHFLAWYQEDGNHPQTVMTDVLYGQLWAEILGLGLLVDKNKLEKQLSQEKKVNDTPYGLKVMEEKGRESTALSKGFYTENRQKQRDELVWEAGSLDWSALNIYLDGDEDEGLEMAGKIFKKWQQQLNDQWDIRDLSTAWNGEPWCNSHYARQLIFWAIPLALSGQQYSAAKGTLSFDPTVSPPAELPVMLPGFTGILKITEDDHDYLQVISGSIKLSEPVINRSSKKEVIILGE
jgi:non-lysosomal glucosylceramidase